MVNNHTHQIEVYVGSPDFSDEQHAGQVDGVPSVRSPGSTLKPLVYAMAIDKGLLTPKQILADVPHNFHGFEPENFYQRFSGPVTVERALVQSLNVTAVRTLESLGLATFVERLKRSDFHQIKQDEKNLGVSVGIRGLWSKP
ncbi:MAG: hypothetical protein HC880_21525 [Bacteroidia bacterium]|nr:hypothetical protein [Bacteroidia bacterium]